MIVIIRFKNAKNITEKDTICKSVYFAKSMALKQTSILRLRNANKSVVHKKYKNLYSLSTSINELAKEISLQWKSK